MSWQVPTNWYWNVQDSSPGTQNWAGARGLFVGFADADYVAFLAAGYIPTSIDTFANLMQLIDDYNQNFKPSPYLAVSSGVNYSLPNTPPLVLNFTPTAAGLVVTLPQMNLPVSAAKGRSIIIHNAGGISFTLNSFGGGAIGTIPNSGYIVLMLIDNTTQAGVFDQYRILGSSLGAVGNVSTTLTSQQEVLIQVWATSAALTAPRTWTLPAANAMPSAGFGGRFVLIVDAVGGVTATNTLSIARAGADTINGGTASIVLNRAYDWVLLETDGTSAWTIVGGNSALNFSDLLGTIAVAQATVAVQTVKKQVFTSNGTYTPSTGMLYCVIECVGGGAGGGSSSSAVATNIFAGGGGGAGSYARKVATASDVGASKTVTIGGGGNGGAAGSNNGAAGSDTSVGTLCVGKGGSGGAFGSVAQNAGGGAGGIAGTGDLTPAAMPGGNGIYWTAAASGATFASNSGNGGSSIFGGGALGVGQGVTHANGNAASNYGSGGSGGYSQGVFDQAGGNGSAGIVVITEFCNQ